MRSVIKYAVFLLCLASAVANAKTTPDAHLQSTNTDVFSLKTELAAQRARRVEAMAAFVRGQELREKDLFQEALDCYEQAIKADPDYLPIKIAKVEALYALNRADEAVQLLETLPEDSPEVCSLLAWGLLKKDVSSQKARQLLEKTIQLALASDSKDPSFYLKITFRLTVLYLKCNDLTPVEIAKKNLPFFEKATALDPRNPQYQLLAAEMSVHAENFEKAITYYEKVSSMAHNLPELRHRIALLLALTNNEEKAIPILEDLVEQKPDQKNLYPLLAELYERTNNLSKAEDHYLLSIKLGQPSVADYLHLALVQIKNKKPDQAAAHLLEAQKLFPTVPLIPLLRGIALRDAEQHADAAAAFGVAEALGESMKNFLDTNFYFEYGVTHERAGNLEQAEKYFQKSLELNPRNHLTMNYLGYTWAERGEKLDEAEKLIKHALELDPPNPAYHDSLGWVYYKKGLYAEAEKETLLAAQDKRGVDDPEINEHLGDIYQKFNDIPKAIHYWQKSLDKAENEKRKQRIAEKIKTHSQSTPPASVSFSKTNAPTPPPNTPADSLLPVNAPNNRGAAGLPK